jgi:broad specificity phosphatase PhoE
LGKRQARLLGEHFISQDIRFDSAYAGTLLRQQQTAGEIVGAFAETSVDFPTLVPDPAWDEFNLAQMERELAPQLSAEDPEFRREYEEISKQVEIAGGAHAAKIHRRWQPCDTKVVEAWIRGRLPYTGETWDEFRERVAACRMKMHDVRRGENILVVTSATPIAIWVGLSLEISDERIMRLAGALHNASYTILRLREGQLRLVTFNAAPHLAAPGLRTHR